MSHSLPEILSPLCLRFPSVRCCGSDKDCFGTRRVLTLQVLYFPLGFYHNACASSTRIKVSIAKLLLYTDRLMSQADEFWTLSRSTRSWLFARYLVISFTTRGVCDCTSAHRSNRTVPPPAKANLSSSHGERRLGSTFPPNFQCLCCLNDTLSTVRGACT